MRLRPLKTLGRLGLTARHSHRDRHSCYLINGEGGAFIVLPHAASRDAACFMGGEVVSAIERILLIEVLEYDTGLSATRRKTRLPSRVASASKMTSRLSIAPKPVADVTLIISCESGPCSALPSQLGRIQSSG